MDEQVQVTGATLRMLADLAALPLAEGREELLVPQLQAWVAGAVELSRKMSEPEHRALTPITVFTHPRR